MARRDEIRVSLFPFMSVLACTIGALVLLLTSLSISAVASRDRSALAAEDARSSGPEARAAEGEAEQRAAADRAEREGRARLEALAALWRRIDAALAARGEATGAPLAALEARAAEARHGPALEADLAALEKARRALADEGEPVEVEIAVLESRRATLPILIDPTGLSRHLAPWFVEVDRKGLTAHRASEDFTSFLPGDELSLSGDYGRYLRRIRATPGGLLVLLIRSDGIATSRLADSLAVQAGVRVARLPLPGQGAIDLSLLRQAEQAGRP